MLKGYWVVPKKFISRESYNVIDFIVDMGFKVVKDNGIYHIEGEKGVYGSVRPGDSRNPRDEVVIDLLDGVYEVLEKLQETLKLRRGLEANGVEISYKPPKETLINHCATLERTLKDDPF